VIAVKEWRLNGVTIPSDGSSFDSYVLENPPRTLVEQLPATMWTTDRELRFTSFVGRGVTRLGLGPNQVVGTSLPRLFDTPNAAMDAVSAHRRALRGETVPLWLTWGSRSLHAVVAPLRDGSQQTIGTIGVAVELRGRSVRAARSAAWSGLAEVAPVA
jgi:hypothetical protein